MKAIGKKRSPTAEWDRHIFIFVLIFVLSRHIGFTALATSSPSRSRQQSTMLTIIADKLSAAGCSWSYCSAVTHDGWRWLVDAHKGKRHIIESDELLSAFLEFEATLV
jgi:hypothetical protein